MAILTTETTEENQIWKFHIFEKLENALTEIGRSNAKTSTSHKEENTDCLVKVHGRRNVDITWITTFVGI